MLLITLIFDGAQENNVRDPADNSLRFTQIDYIIRTGSMDKQSSKIFNLELE